MANYINPVQTVAAQPTRQSNEVAAYINLSVPFVRGGETTHPKLGRKGIELMVGNELHEILLKRYREEGEEFIETLRENLIISIYDKEAEANKPAGLGF